jgi:hypothetical protein
MRSQLFYSIIINYYIFKVMFLNLFHHIKIIYEKKHMVKEHKYKNRMEEVIF